MKTAITGCFSPGTAALWCLAALIVNGTSPAAVAVGEEPAVWQSTVEFIARDNVSRPYKILYFQSDFESAPLVVNSMADPNRKEFKDLCGLSASDARAMVAQLQAINAEPVKLEEPVAEAGSLKIGKKKNLRARYVALSRVVIDPTNQHAWVAIDLSGTTGAILRFDKVAGQWSKTARCGGWMKSE
jgi:hypothetical protein